VRNLLILLSALLGLASCSIHPADQLDESEFLKFEIKKYRDSVYYQVPNAYWPIFKDKWNNALHIGPTKYIAAYTIKITFLKDSVLQFRINQQHIKASDDQTYNIGDKTFIEELWRNSH